MWWSWYLKDREHVKKEKRMTGETRSLYNVTVCEYSISHHWKAHFHPQCSSNSIIYFSRDHIMSVMVIWNTTLLSPVDDMPPTAYLRNIYAINVVGLWITFTFPTCWLKDCPQEGSQAQGGQMSELDGGWQSEWTVRHIDVERMIEIWRGEVERKEVGHEL